MFVPTPRIDYVRHIRDRQDRNPPSTEPPDRSMLFNSFEFLLLFAPLTFIGTFVICARWGRTAAIHWLIAASLFFYGWWNPPYLVLIVTSVVVNFGLHRALVDAMRGRIWILTIGIVANLTAIGYFKYANFFLSVAGDLGDTQWSVGEIALPLAISFFTFQQIALLVDTWRGDVREISFSRYALFVLFFPQLIAGPIVRAGEIISQFEGRTVFGLNTRNIAIGLTIFLIGLFKKVVVADGIAVFATPVFQAAADGTLLTVWEAWGGALAFTFQLYFDFSGYSDMAIGLARIVGLRLPVNFYAPYKATSIRDFWRRWHITLSRFLRDYLYIPLGGNRRGRWRQSTNVLITMFLGGLWHGAAWTFVLWGVVHGLALAINNMWDRRRTARGHTPSTSAINRWRNRLATFVFVVLAWVLFRAESIEGALAMYKAMFGFNGLSLPEIARDPVLALAPAALSWGVTFDGMFHNATGDWLDGTIWLVILVAAVWGLPNSMEIMRRYNAIHLDLHQEPQKALRSWRPVWRPTLAWASLVGVFTAASVLLMILGVDSEFLYYQF